MKSFYAFLLIFPSLLFAESYWQQHVQYSINATLDTKQHRIIGNEKLVYTNNSPDTLHYVLFRLYWNLFTEGSRGSELNQRHKYFWSDTTGGIQIKSFSVLEGDNEREPSYSIDNTLMRIELPVPLLPGGSRTFSFEWTGKVPEGGGRTGHQGRDYNIAQWYPQIATYDKFGWDESQYLGPAEFHNEFGSFDVQLTLPKSFTLGFTGELLNPQEVYPESVITKLANAEGKKETQPIADYSTAEWKNGEDTTQATWKFRAENVRDFAWSANEHYIWDVSHYAPNDGEQPVTIHALYFSDKAEYWKNAAEYGRHAITYFSEHFGKYAYKNCFAVEGVVGGGMEYPGITFIGHYGDENNHDPFGVIVHELGHNWNPMMIGANETKFAFMDEGFTTFMTSVATEAYWGRFDNYYTWTTWYQKLLAYPNDDNRSDIQRGSINLAKTGYEEPAATYIYRFTQEHYGGSIYGKTAAVLYMLQYVLGDSVFEVAMKEYYNRWKFKHPYPEDFYATMQEMSGNRDMRWFFDQWLNRTYTCDYGICNLQYQPVVKNDLPVYKTSFHIYRKGEAIMPLDVQIEMEDGNKQTVWVPVNKWFNTEVDFDTTIELQSKPVRAEINPDGRIMDMNRLNNRTGMPRIQCRFDNTFMYVPSLDAYQLRWRPSFWYTDEGGWNFGYKLGGSYLEDMSKFSLYHLYNIREKTFDVDFTLGTNLHKISTLSSVEGRAYTLEGRKGYSLFFSKGFRKSYIAPPYHTLTLQYSYSQVTNREYLLHPQTWDDGRLHRMIVGYNYYNRGRNWTTNGTVSLEGSSSLFGQSDFQYSKRTIELRTTFNIPGGSTLGVRLYNGIGYGNLPSQAKYYVGGGSPLEQFGYPFYRSKGVLPSTVRDHTFAPGGGDVRGYYTSLLAGDKMDAFNLEWKWRSILPVSYPRVPYVDDVLRYIRGSVFMDAARYSQWNERLWDQRFEIDLGVGLQLSSFYSLLGEASQSNIFSALSLRTLRIDFPFFMSYPFPGENKFKFRWAISLNEVF